ncbi:unnamed protein product, partial [Laminaria digitata]
WGPVSRPPLHGVNRRASAFGNIAGEGHRRASLQAVIGSRPRRASIVPSSREGGQSQSEPQSAARSLRKRLSVGVAAADPVAEDAAAVEAVVEEDVAMEGVVGAVAV